MPAQPEPTAAQIPAPVVNEAFLTDLKKTSIANTDDPQDRLFRSHGMLENPFFYTIL